MAKKSDADQARQPQGFWIMSQIHVEAHWAKQLVVGGPSQLVSSGSLCLLHNQLEDTFALHFFTLLLSLQS